MGKGDGMMLEKDKIRSIAPLHYRYPLVEEMPDKYTLCPVPFGNEEVQKFGVLFFYRLMKKNYGYPSEIEWEKINREEKEEGKPTIYAVGKEWKYFLRTPSGGIIQVGTEAQHNFLKLFIVLPDNVVKPNERSIKEAEKFVTDLLAEAARLKGQILNPLKEFEEGEGLQLYLLDNVYVFNYGCAELMLEQMKDYENDNIAEMQKCPAEVFWRDKEKMAYHDKYLLGLGMYYCSTILYYFIALEGFINLVYYAFLKENLKDLNLEQRLDLELKILLMPGLCNGFREDFIDTQSDAFQGAKKLVKYRNQTLHAKVIDSMKDFTFLEDGFLYRVDMEKNLNTFLPVSRSRLTKEDVIKVKQIVDSMIEEIMTKMDDESRKLMDKFIMKQLLIPFWKDEGGKITFGHLESGD